MDIAMAIFMAGILCRRIGECGPARGYGLPASASRHNGEVRRENHRIAAARLTVIPSLRFPAHGAGQDGQPPWASDRPFRQRAIALRTR